MDNVTREKLKEIHSAVEEAIPNLTPYPDYTDIAEPRAVQPIRDGIPILEWIEMQLALLIWGNGETAQERAQAPLIADTGEGALGRFTR